MGDYVQRNFVDKGIEVHWEHRSFKEQGIDSERGNDLYDTDALILFQYGGKILGFGIVQDRNSDDRYFQFYPESIHNVEQISADELRSVYPSFKRFVRMKKIPLKYLKSITLLLEKKQKSFAVSKSE